MSAEAGAIQPVTLPQPFGQALGNRISIGLLRLAQGQGTGQASDQPRPSASCMSASRFRTALLASDTEVQALLKRLDCPTPFHEVRTIFMGSIASPNMSVAPMQTLAMLWGGELPEFASQDDLQEVAQVLIQGLWNRLADHQNSRSPFRLLRTEVPVTREGMLSLADSRCEELAGFMDGLFGGEAAIHLPQKAHDAVTRLGELYFMHEAVGALLADESKPAPVSELKPLLRNLHQMAIIADDLINKTIQSCKRARGQHPEPMADHLMRHPLMDDDEAGQNAGEVASDELEPDSIESPLSQSLSRHGVTVRVEIYGDGEGRWILEVVDRDDASHVWDERFETDQAALDAAIEALETEPAEFAGQSPSPLKH